jgi:RNA polymerase sigma factor (sigma-70 family)
MTLPATGSTDAELLRQFVQDRSEGAFRRLTERHLDLVFGTALRRVGDRGAAEELTQNVFIALARKAAWLQREGSVAAWLHRTTLLEARQWWRGELRRRQREQTAGERETTMKTSIDDAPGMAGVLDEALLELREGERQAVLLRFLEGRNHREIGAVLGIGEDAARKRVDKALDQMMGFFRRRGLAVGSTALLAGLLTASATAAPSGLTGSVWAAVANCGVAATAPWLAKLLGLTRTQLAGACVAVLLVPAAWQQARLVSARGELRRLEATLTLVQSQHSGVTEELGRVQARLARQRTLAHWLP